MGRPVTFERLDISLEEFGRLVDMNRTDAFYIAGLAAVEAEGVTGLAGNMTNEIIERLGMKSLSKGVKVVVGNNSASIEVAVCLDYGVNIMNVSEDIQEKVKTAVESMTGITIESVNVRVANVNIEND